MPVKKKSWWKRWWGVLLIILAVFVAFASITGEPDDPDDRVVADAVDEPDGETRVDDELDELEPEPEPEPDTEDTTDQDPAEEPDEPEEPDDLSTAGDLWTVTNIVDGDTIDVLSHGGVEERVRLVGIDTPERGECGFNRASDFLAGMILGQDVKLTTTAGGDDRDRYDRLLRYIDHGDTDAGLELIKAGLSISRYDSRDGYGRHPRQEDYIAADDATEHICADAAPAPEPEPEPAPSQPEPSPSGPGTGPSGAWKNCTEARDAGAAPVRRDDPGYGTHLDRDGDGIGCE